MKTYLAAKSAFLLQVLNIAPNLLLNLLQNSRPLHPTLQGSFTANRDTETMRMSPAGAILADR